MDEVTESLESLELQPSPSRTRKEMRALKRYTKHCVKKNIQNSAAKSTLTYLVKGEFNRRIKESFTFNRHATWILLGHPLSEAPMGIRLNASKRIYHLMIQTVGTQPEQIGVRNSIGFYEIQEEPLTQILQEVSFQLG
jgi:hypothetical protein